MVSGVGTIEHMFECLPVQETVASLAGTDPADLSDEHLVDRMTAAAAVSAWAESVGLLTVAELRRRRQEEYTQVTDGRPDPTGAASGDEVDRFTAVEVAAALRVSQRAAVHRVGLAHDLARLPATLAALGDGLIGLGHARAVLEAVEVAEDDLARAVEAHVLQRPDRTPAQLAHACRRLVDAGDPAAAERRCTAAKERRLVHSWAVGDGMAALQVTGAATAVAGAWAHIDALARQAQQAAVHQSRDAFGRLVRAGTAGADEAGSGGAGSGWAGSAGAGPGGADLPAGVPTLDQLRADTMLRLLCGSHDLAELPCPSVSVGIDVLVPLSTLAGLGGGTPAELAGYGPLPDSVARALAATAARIRVTPLSDDGAVHTPCSGTGTPTTGTTEETTEAAAAAAIVPGPQRCAHGPTTYRPAASVAANVQARDVTCRFPGCRRRATSCDLDHTIPHPQGPTVACNLASLCRTHHRVKHRGGWHVEQLGSGRLRWISPTGHTYQTEPPRWEHHHPPHLRLVDT